MAADPRIEAALVALKEGQPAPDWLVEQLRLVAQTLVRHGNLPVSLSPYGNWDEEAAAEIFQGWMEGRLLRSGGLLALLSRASSPSSLRRLAQRNLRQWLANQAQRSQSQNLYRRMNRLLRQQDGFVERHPASRPQDVFWTTAELGDAELFAGPERELAPLAWSLGEFALLRFTSSHISPLLSEPDLERFIVGMIETAGRAMTLSQLMAALRLRFALEEPYEADLDQAPAEAVALPGDQAEALALRDAAWAVIAELLPRQADVLLGKRAGESLETLAERHGCGLTTIDNELRRIGTIIAAHVSDDAERDRLTTLVGDMLFEVSG